MKPHTAQSPCPICHGHKALRQGLGIRCFGFVSDDGEYAHCTREELAGSLEQHAGSQGYAHRLAGDCRCGITHGAADPNVRQIGEARGAQVVATYDYCDEAGALVYQVVRKEPKTFLQRRPNGSGGWTWNLGDAKPLPYRLPEVIAAVAAGGTVYIVEGEKDAQAVYAAGGVATCNSGGAGKWKPEFALYFKGATVVIVRDRDEVGHEHARDVFRGIRTAVSSVCVAEARVGKDAADHLAAGHTLESFMPVWPLEALRKSDPVAWKQALVRRSIDPGDPYRKLDYRAALAQKEPTWPTGLGGENPNLPNFRGVTILTGAPSAGKSVLAIASAVQAAWAGWDVLYLSSEMGDRTVAERLERYCGEGALPPKALEVQTVSFGADVPSLVDLVAERVGKRNLLVVFDSISSFVDQALAAPSEGDVHHIGPLKQLLMWSINVKRHTEGQVSFLVLSETNAEGRTKGRFGDHKADLVVTLKTDPDYPSVKELTTVKGWDYPTGRVGLYGLDYETGQFTKNEG